MISSMFSLGTESVPDGEALIKRAKLFRPIGSSSSVRGLLKPTKAKATQPVLIVTHLSGRCQLYQTL